MRKVVLLALFSSLFSLAALPLISIRFGKYFTDWFSVTLPLVVVACRVAMDISPWLIAARLHQPFRNQLPSSSIVDEFNQHFVLVWTIGKNISKIICLVSVDETCGEKNVKKVY